MAFRARLTCGVLLTMTISLLTACTKTIDNKELEADIQKDTATKGVRLTSVTCPAGERLREGTKFECSCVDKHGTQGTFDVEIANGHGRVEWKLRNKYMNMRIVGDSLEANLSKKLNQVVDVVCPEDNILIKKDVSFTCDVKVGAKAEQITLTAKSDDGSSWDEKITSKS
jgi:hypothetical protein